MAPGPKGMTGRRFARADHDPKFREDPSRTRHRRTEIIAKLVQTRAQHRSFAPTEAQLCLMGR